MTRSGELDRVFVFWGVVFFATPIPCQEKYAFLSVDMCVFVPSNAKIAGFAGLYKNVMVG